MAESTLASKLQYDISATLTDVPGTQNIELSGLENKSFKTGGIADAVDTNLGTGTSEPGSIKFDLLYDPANVVHKQMRTDHDAGGVSIPVMVHIAATGGTEAVTVTSKKFDLKAEKHGGWIASVEWECEDVPVVVDPV